MDGERRPADSHRFLKLAKEFRDKEFRDTYVAAHTRRFLAWQMRKFRGDLSQTEFARALDKQQTIVSRLENPNYSGWTLGTLLEIANKLNVGLLVRFVDFPTFLKNTDDLSEDALHPTSYDQQQVDDFARSNSKEKLSRALEILRPKEPQKASPDVTGERSTSLASVLPDDDSTAAKQRHKGADQRAENSQRAEILKFDLERAAVEFQRPQPRSDGLAPWR